ncbi:MAG: malonyl CoA-ACP transacylase [Mycobacterium sp.]|nr:malonyl CoA-ACP transacylase [Mycobacterium sp.]
MNPPDTVATVAGRPVPVTALDDRESRLRAGGLASSLPRPGTSEGRQLRRWLAQLLVTEQVVRAAAEALAVSDLDAPTETELLPDPAARMEIGSITAAALEQPLARALFVRVTAAVRLGDDEVADYHARNPMRFARPVPGPDGWSTAATVAPPLTQVRRQIAEHLLGSARRRAFRRWLDARRAESVYLAPGYEHPGDPRQPDHVHRH